MALVMVTGRYNRGHRRFYRWCSPGGLPAVLERFHRSTTRVPVWPVLPVGYGGTTAASWRRKYRPQPLARTRQRYNRFLERYNRRATLGLYIPLGLVGVSFLPSPALPILCPSRRPPLPLPRSASRASDPWGLRGSSPRRPPPSRSLPMDAGNAPCPSFFVLGFVPFVLGHYLTFRVYCLNYWVEEITFCLLLRLHVFESRIWLV